MQAVEGQFRLPHVHSYRELAEQIALRHHEPAEQAWWRQQLNAAIQFGLLNTQKGLKTFANDEPEFLAMLKERVPVTQLERCPAYLRLSVGLDLSL
ncbi:hypothetical protein D3C81_2057380 [compost metagenome]